jgi:hypothetical protein
MVPAPFIQHKKRSRSGSRDPPSIPSISRTPALAATVLEARHKADRGLRLANGCAPGHPARDATTRVRIPSSVARRPSGLRSAVGDMFAARERSRMIGYREAQRLRPEGDYALLLRGLCCFPLPSVRYVGCRAIDVPAADERRVHLSRKRSVCGGCIPAEGREIAG